MTTRQLSPLHSADGCLVVIAHSLVADVSGHEFDSQCVPVFFNFLFQRY